MNKRPRLLLLASMVLSLGATVATGALADDAPAAAPAPMIHTGDSVRTKSVGPFTAKVYAIGHDMAGRPPQKSKQAVVEADTDKKFTWRMLRDVESSKIQKALREAFAMNGYNDASKINAFVGAFDKDEVKESSSVVIRYNAASKTTTIAVQSGGSATIAGPEFMKAVWSIWLGKIDQPSMGDQLIAKL